VYILFRTRGGDFGGGTRAESPGTCQGIHRRSMYKGDTSTHVEGTDPRGGLERASEGEEALSGVI